MLNDEQIAFLKKLGIELSSKDISSLSDNELWHIEEVVSDKLQLSGFNDGYNTTMEGKMCEEILDLIGEI